ncbi:glycosylphosphatidylinositol anchor biosynthesis, partial [Coemansia sp. RSA 2603]
MKIVPARIGVPFLSRRRDGNVAPSSSVQLVRDAAHNDGERRSSSISSGGANSGTLAPETSPSAVQALETGVCIAASASEPSNVAVRQEEMRARRPWRKLLYIKQEYPDDYVDGTFLMELQKNTNVRMYDYPIIVMQTAVVTQHISSIMVFIAVFINLYRGSLAGHALLWVSSIITVLGFVFWDILSLYLHTPERRIVRFNLIKGCVLFAMLLFGLSPILRTLTEDTSSDTIWAMTVIFFCVNLAFHDYSTGNLTNIRFPGSVSLNAAILASVLLASQLDSNLSVFAFLAFALEWFGLFPISRRYLRRVSAAASMVMA